MTALGDIDLDSLEFGLEITDNLLNGGLRLIGSMSLTLNDDWARSGIEFFRLGVDVLRDSNMDVLAFFKGSDGIVVGTGDEWVEFAVDVIKADDCVGSLEENIHVNIR